MIALVVLGIGAAVELLKTEGISPTFAGFLGAIVAAFSAANYAVTREHMHMKVEQQGGGDGDRVAEKLDELAKTIQASADPQSLQALVSVLSKLNNDIDEVKQGMLPLSEGMVNTQKAVSALIQRR